MTLSGRYVGKPIIPKESIKYIIGEGEYIDDMKANEMLYMAVLRSPYPRAVIKRVDCDNDALRWAKLVLLPSDQDALLKGVIMPANFDHKGTSNVVRMPVLPTMEE
jgi:CO/xanthine dehydrogenase Mo-binding subunit